MFNSRNEQDKPDFLSREMIKDMAEYRAQLTSVPDGYIVSSGFSRVDGIAKQDCTTGTAVSGAYIVGTSSGALLGNGGGNGWTSINPSLADHIEQRTCRMQADLDRLKRIKAQISKDGILNVPMDDLRFAMSN